MTKHHSKNPFSASHLSIPAPKQFTSSIKSIPIVNKTLPTLPIISHVQQPVQAPKLNFLNKSVAQISHHITNNSNPNSVLHHFNTTTNSLPKITNNSGNFVAKPLKTVSKNAFTTISHTLDNSIKTVSNTGNIVSKLVASSVATLSLIPIASSNMIGIGNSQTDNNNISNMSNEPSTSDSMIIPVIAIGSVVLIYFTFIRR